MSLPVACAILTTIVLLALLVVGWIAYRRTGAIGLGAAAIAAGVCWLASIAALVLIGATRGTALAVQGILGASLVRLLLPLMAAVTLQVAGRELTRAGALVYLVVFFLLALTVDTLLLVPLVRSPGNTNAPPSPPAAPAGHKLAEGSSRHG